MTPEEARAVRGAINAAVAVARFPTDAAEVADTLTDLAQTVPLTDRLYLAVERAAAILRGEP